MAATPTTHHIAISDEAAQIVALVPRLASAGRPFQRQAERQQLESPNQRVFALSRRLQNPNVRTRNQFIPGNIKADPGFTIEHPLLQKPLSQRHIDALFPPLAASGQQSAPIPGRKD